MASTNFQECAHLQVNDLYKESSDPLKELFEAQRKTQTEDYGYNWEEVSKTVGSVKKFVDWNYHAMQDEMREMYNGLGGVHSAGSAAWKPWKSQHLATLEKPFDDLTESELKELHMEFADMSKFFINMCIAVRLTPEGLYNLFFAKHLENIRRQETGTY